MNSRHALVTGATGFVGSHLISRLLNDGWHVSVIIRPSSTLPSYLCDDHRISVLVDQGVKKETRAAIIKAAPQVCFHLATYFVAQHSEDDINSLIESNISFGTFILDALSQINNVALVNVGTVWQHFDGRAYSPVSLYAATKQAFQDIIKYYAECTSLRATTLELTDTYGPKDKRRKLLHLLIESAKTDEKLSMSAGEQIFDIIHIDDVIQALMIALTFASHEAQCFAIRSNFPLNLRSFVEEVSKTLGISIEVAWGSRPYRPREMLKTWNYTPTLPHWEPKITLQNGLQTLLKEL